MATVLVAVTAVLLSLLLIYLTMAYVVPVITEWQICKKVSATEFKAIDGSEGAGSSDLHYFILSYDCRRKDVIVRGEVPQAMHWQIGAFDGSLRLIDGGYVNHRSALVDNGRFEVVVSRDPEVGARNIDCSSSPRGLLIFRVLCAVVAPEKPVVEIQQHKTALFNESSWGIDR